MSVLGSIIGGVFGLGQSIYNNEMAAQRAREDRHENYMYGEMAADAADKRTRALYGDLYSPQALMEQYKEAGLSPAMMFGGTPGGGGTSGAQGGGAAGIQTPYMPVSMLEAVQAANIAAQTEKTKAETENVKQDTGLKELDYQYKKLTNSTYKREFRILNANMFKENGDSYSIYECAIDSKDYDSFLKDIREAAESSNNWELKGDFESETGQRILRRVYTQAKQMTADLAAFKEAEVSANFNRQLIEVMDKSEFKQLNAEAAVKYLKANIQTAELTEGQKEAWNNVLKKIEEEEGSTMKDLIVVLAMILNNGMQTWNMPSVNNNNTYRTTNNNYNE